MTFPRTEGDIREKQNSTEYEIKTLSEKYTSWRTWKILPNGTGEQAKGSTKPDEGRGAHPRNGLTNAVITIMDPKNLRHYAIIVSDLLLWCTKQRELGPPPQNESQQAGTR